MEIRKTGKIYKVDDTGHLVCNQEKSNIQEKWNNPLNDIVEKYKDFFKDNIHSIYVRGSVATGEACDYTSDIDLIILFDEYWNQSMDYYFKQFNLSLNKDIMLTYPFVQKIDFGFDPGTCYKSLLDKNENMSFLDTMFLIKHHSVCIYGENIQEKIPRFKMDLIPRTYYDLEKIINRLKNSLFQPNLNTDQIQGMSGWISKKIVRCGYELIMDDLDIYTRDLYQCWKLFSKSYPDKRNDMKFALKNAIWPTDDKNDLFEVFNKIGDWLTEEIKNKLPNDSFNVQSLRKVQNELYKLR